MVCDKSACAASGNAPGQLASRRSVLRAVGIGAAVLGTAGCAQDPLRRSSTPTSVASSASPAGDARRRSSHGEWVHFGDSFVNLSRMVPACAELTGYEHMDASMIGDTSLVVAIRSGCQPLKARLDGNRIPAKGSVEVIDFDPPTFKVHEGVDLPVEIDGVQGTIVQPRDSGKTWFKRDRSGNELKISEPVEITVDPRHEQSVATKGIYQNYSVVFSLGRNDIDIGGSVDDLVKNIRTMIDKHPADDLKYVVTDIPAWHNERIGAPEREELDAWNGKLKQEFGDAFIEPFRWLIDHREKSFALAGQTMDDADRAAENDGVIPDALTIDDRGHLSEAGGKACAAGFFEEFKRLHLV